MRLEMSSRLRRDETEASNARPLSFKLPSVGLGVRGGSYKYRLKSHFSSIIVKCCCISSLPFLSAVALVPLLLAIQPSTGRWLSLSLISSPPKKSFRTLCPRPSANSFGQHVSLAQGRVCERPRTCPSGSCPRRLRQLADHHRRHLELELERECRPGHGIDGAAVGRQCHHDSHRYRHRHLCRES